MCDAARREYEGGTDMAFSFGSSNRAHFSRVFRAHLGIAPSDYRRATLGAAGTRLTPDFSGRLHHQPQLVALRLHRDVVAVHGA